MLICAAVFIASYVVRYFVLEAMRMAYYQQQAIRAAQRKQLAKQKATNPAPSSPTGGTAAAPPKAQSNLTGPWNGSAGIPGKGRCWVRVELTEPEPEKYSGNFTMNCNGTGPMVARNRKNGAIYAQNQLDPVAVILSGTGENGIIKLNTDKVIGTDTSGCAPTSITLTPYGATELAAQWEEGPNCEGWHLLMRRARQ